MQHIEVTATKAVILSVVVFLLSVNSFAAAYVDSLDIPGQIPMEGDFRITARLSGDTCGVQARFYIDQKFINSNLVSLHINQNILLKRVLICGNWQESEAL